MLVEEDEVLREPAGAVVLADAFGQGAQVDEHLVETDAVGLPLPVLAAEVVHPEDVVVPGREHGAGELDLEGLVHDVRQVIPAGERRLRRLRDDRVHLGLGIVLLLAEGELQRQPDEARVLPPLPLILAHGFRHVHEALEDVRQPRDLYLGGPALAQEPARERRVGAGDELSQAVRVLPLPQEAVVGEQHLLQEDPPRRVADAGAILGTGRAERPVQSVVEGALPFGQEPRSSCWRTASSSAA